MTGARAIALSVALAALGASGVQARAQAPGQSLFLATVYDVQPAPPPDGEQMVARGQTVLEQPLRPRGLFELQGPVFLPAGLPRLAEGTEAPTAGTRLFRVDTVRGTVGCVLPSSSASAAGQWLPCLFDQNSDDRFEALFFARNADIAVPTVGGYIPLVRVFTLAEPVGYRQLDPALLDNRIFVSVRRSSRFDLFGRTHLETWLRGAAGAGRLPGTVAMRPSRTPDEVSVLDARFSVRAGPGGAIQVTVLEPIPPRALNMPDVRKGDWIPIPMPMPR